MIATWMFYCLACALGLAFAAVVAERALLAGRGPVRHVWLAALVLSFALPVAAYRYAPRTVQFDATVSALDETHLDVSAVATLPPATPSSATSAAQGSGLTARGSQTATQNAQRRNWRSFVASTDRPLTVVWIGLSVALALYFAVGIVLLARTRKAWRRHTVLGVPVFVSERTGPALVGAVSPAIVVPEWALALDATQLSLMLRHEQEHQRAHDGRLLLAAQLALIVMPWNVALWWQILRLRVAVELDCDARVLQNADARSYGNLLLEVVRPREVLAPVGVTAFAERATQLERRIRVMARGGRVWRGARVAATLTAVGAISIAWIAPRPNVPAAPAVVSADTVTRAQTIPPRDTSRAQPSQTRLQVPRRDSAPARAATAQRDTSMRPAAQTAKPDSSRGVDTGRVATTLATPDIVVPIGGGRGGRGGLLPPQLANTIYTRLFDGIALAPTEEGRARAIIDSLLQMQTAMQDSIRPAMQIYTASLAQARANRDSTLVKLPMSDADRATLMSRLIPQPGGRRGGAPGDPPQVGGARGGGGRGGAAGGGGGGGRGDTGGGRGVAPLDPQMQIEAAYSRLFAGITLTPDQEAAARTAIAKQLVDQRNAVAPRPRQVIGVPAFDSTVVIDARGDSALMMLITNDSDKQKLRGRIVRPALPINVQR
ncbi:MAG TPA: M56 family metallopeptidase [Gemmatimonadaceae bacterium]|nr:M56 family metallopeptidase [Gemmatimonadaceae bacterium]